MAPTIMSVRSVALLVQSACASLELFPLARSVHMKRRVLFLCATNGVQSPMAEALLNRLDPEHFDVISAGIDRGEIHPLMVEVMREIGVDLERRVARAARDLLEGRFDFGLRYVIEPDSNVPSFREPSTCTGSSKIH